jgi:putative SOS response-associated peptidase YedK
MCYDAVSATRQLLKYALHRGDVHHAEELARKLHELMSASLRPYYYVSGFSHPGLLVFTNDKPMEPQVFTWGLIPSWTNDRKSADIIMNQTLNARAETIFEKPAFKKSAVNRRCIVYLDAFYEHHHSLKRTYPFHISRKDGAPLVVAGLWDEWVDRSTGEIFKTVSIITTEGNSLMRRIHNNPKAEGPRMPVILERENQDAWLIPCTNENDKALLVSLLKPAPEELFSSYTVSGLKGKNGIGNIPEAETPVEYPGLEHIFS